MIRNMVAAATVIASVCLAACGGSGGDSSTAQPAAKKMTISMYGNPLVSAPVTVAHARFSLISSAEAATPPTAASDAQTTVQTLQDALTARGVTASVTEQVMDGTTLHQIVMGVDNGLPPTPDQFKSDPSEWIIVNFQLDDMVTRVDDPTQQAAIQQFIQDLTVFTQRAWVSGKGVWAVLPFQTCDAPPGFSASDGLRYALIQAESNSGLLPIGATSFGFFYDAFGNITNTADMVHLGADCRTPDAYLQNLRVQAVADKIADIYKAPPPGAYPASGASATGT